MNDQFDSWYRTEIAPFEPALRKRIRRLLGTDSDVEDILWSTYEKLLVNGSWRAAERPTALVYRIAHNLAIDQIRRRRVVSFEGSLEAFRQTAEDVPGPEERLDDKRALAVLMQAIDELPEQCRRVFKMRRLDGLSTDQISNRTGLSISTIEKHVAKGLRRCSSRLSEVGLERTESRSWRSKVSIARR